MLIPLHNGHFFYLNTGTFPEYPYSITPVRFLNTLIPLTEMLVRNNLRGRQAGRFIYEQDC